MSITLDWLHVISLLGAVQGLFLAGVLVTKRTNWTANRLLAAVTVTFSIYLLSAVYYAVGWMEVFPHFFGVANPLPLLFGPLIYLYAVQASDRTRRLRTRDLLHFVPAAAVVITTLPGYLQSGAVFNFVTSEFPVVAASPAPPADQPARYQRSGLGDQEAESLKDALLLIMERERPYQDSELTLADLAERFNTTPHKLSEVLSQKIGQTFYDFVNRYRRQSVVCAKNRQWGS